MSIDQIHIYITSNLIHESIKLGAISSSTSNYIIKTSVQLFQSMLWLYHVVLNEHMRWDISVTLYGAY